MFSNQLDNYEAETVENIPEQFDLSRYRKSIKTPNTYRGSSAPPTQAQVQNSYPQNNQQNYGYRPNKLPYQENTQFPVNPNLDLYASPKNFINPQLGHNPTYSSFHSLPPKKVSNIKVNNSSDLLSTPGIPPQQFIQYQQAYPAFQLNSSIINPNQSILHQQQPQISTHQHPQVQVQLSQQQSQQQSQAQSQQNLQNGQFLYNNIINPTQMTFYPTKEFESMHLSSQYPINTSTMKKNPPLQTQYLPENNYIDQAQDVNYSTNLKPVRPDSGRKKNSFDDEDDDNHDPFQKKEYFLKGGEDLVKPGNTTTLNRINSSQSELSTGSIMPKSNLKTSTRKPGVTFDEKLEVYEVKNPHYGLDVKSEKREMKRKKKDKQKEEENVIKTKLEMKSKIQNKNMILYNFYEKTLVYNTLVYYEENYYRSSIVKLQEKLRTGKPDEKIRDQLIQIVEKENQITTDIIKHVKKDYFSKLEPYLSQYQTTVEKLHTIPGMFQVIQNAANSVNYSDIINYYITKDLSTSPTGLRKKILGSEAKMEKFLANNQSTLLKTPIQRKTDLFMPRYTIAAIDSHVRDICFGNFKTISEIIYKLYEICDNDLNMVRAIYKYLLMTQLETFRRNDTGSFIMRNFDMGIESTNTIFSRFCSFAGIENHLVKGLWKTICQDPGDKVETKSIWNIVNLECGWRFIQPAFTPVKYYFKRPEIIYEETEFYFMSDADSLFYEFLPNDKIWTFNETPISNLKEYVKEFEKKPIITPEFRTLNLSILNVNYKTASIGKEAFKLAIKYPTELADKINFKYVLKPINLNISSFSSVNNASNQIYKNDHSNQTYEPYNLNLFVISELISDQNAVSFKISALPEIGNYNLTIYASLTEDLSLHSSPIPSIPILNQDCKAIISFKVTCSKVSSFELPPNHITDINVFGTNLIMKRLGLDCCDFKQGILGTDSDGKLNLVFAMNQPLDIQAYLYSSDQSISSKYLEVCLLKRVVQGFLVIIISPPHAGLYGLDLHGAPKGTYNSLLHTQLPPIGKYLIKCHYQLKSFCQFPKGDNRNWGPKQRFYDLGMHTMGHIDPYIVNEDGKQIEIEIAMLKSLTIWYRFDHDHNGKTTTIDNYCLMNYKNTNKSERSVSFLLRFPYRGFYHLAIMATDDVFPTSPDEIVYNYLIRVQDPSDDVEPFPTILDPILWKDCCLIAPKNFILNRYDVHFSILVPRTNQVQITNGERCIDKLEPKEIENSWVGLVSICDSYSRFIYIEAEFENKYKKLVRFSTGANTKEN